MKTNRSKSVIQSEPACRNGFTLLDLLVVLGVVAVLITLQLPVLASGKGQTKIGVCASHVRQLALACQIYANDNSDHLPVLSGSAAWPWDLPVPVVDKLLKSGAATNTFYCPGTAPRFTDQDNWLAPAPSSLWNFNSSGGASGSRIVGYSLAFSGYGSFLHPTNQNSTMLPETIMLGSTPLPAPAASERVLLADATISVGSSLPGYLSSYNNYTAITGGFAKQHLSPHLKGNIPAGGNLGFKDGHVAWRQFKLMTPRTTAAGPYFWW